MSKEAKQKKYISHLESTVDRLKNELQLAQERSTSLQGAIQERLKKDREIMGEWDTERQALVKLLSDIRTVVIGTALDDEEQLDKGPDAIFQDIVGGLHALQLELQRVATTQKTVLSATQVVACEHSCIQCQGPAPDLEGELTPEQQEQMEKRLIAKCEIQKVAKGIALYCPMLVKTDDFATIEKGVVDGGTESAGEPGSQRNGPNGDDTGGEEKEGTD